MLSKILVSPTHSAPYQDSPPLWRDSNILKSIQCVAWNVFFATNGMPLAVTRLVNIPLRLWNVRQAFNSGEYWQIGFDVLAFVSLCFPGGRIVAICLDVVSGAVSTYKQISSHKNEESYDKQPKDCTTLAAALEVLGLSEKDAFNHVVLEERYQKLCKEWDKRINEAGSSEPLLKMFRRMKFEAGEAYATVSRHIEKPII